MRNNNILTAVGESGRGGERGEGVARGMDAPNLLLGIPHSFFTIANEVFVSSCDLITSSLKHLATELYHCQVKESSGFLFTKHGIKHSHCAFNT